MANFNKVLLIGNLTKDPELRYTPQGTAVVNLRLAVNRRFKDSRTQELKEDTCFVTGVVWDKQAETCNQYLHKGSPVFIEGRLQSRSWEDNSGQKRNVIEVRVERVQFLGAAPKKAEPSFADSPSQEASKEPSTETSWLEESEGAIQ
ncbi:MAG: single-stranded DNA-binding protein [Candidatus Omnitrophica bacterium]|nr:single-stranded DNA-binding protein [Nitrospirota bacterium]MBU4345726.1 single-stranded DNA-binding protein [Candidatus Omnitrophota bacterium]MBU4473145.1 single-stranded DNA-binding protein [Candidatus Omnitrophota bacterium]MCG2706432.1 single-stranded DNA-binding protein [Candidatus Omnitrophota bacterium]